MKNKYQILFWIWIFCCLFVSVFEFFMNIDKPFANQTVQFFKITSYLLLSLVYFVSFSTLLSSTVDELAVKAKKQLLWTEYFDLKRKTKMPLDRNDEIYAAEKVEVDKLPDFLNQFTKTEKGRIIRIGLCLCIIIVLLIFDTIFKKHSNKLLLINFVSYANIFFMFCICYFYIKLELPLQKNRFYFAKKIDQLVAENKLRI